MTDKPTCTRRPVFCFTDTCTISTIPSDCPEAQEKAIGVQLKTDN